MSERAIKMLNLHKKIPLGVKISIFTTALIFVSAIAFISVSYFFFKDSVAKIYGENALNYARFVRSVIDVDEFKKMLDSKQKNDHWNLIRETLVNLKREANLLFAYIILPSESDEYAYFANGGLGGEYGSSDTFKDFLTTDPKSAYPPETDQIMADGLDVITDVYFADIYPPTLTGFCPIVDKSGETLGLIGIDVVLGAILARSSGFFTTLCYSTFAFCVVVTAITIKYLRDDISKPLETLAKSFYSLADGEISDDEFSGVKVNSFETLALKNALTNIASTYKKLFSQLKSAQKKRDEGVFERVIDENSFKGFFKVIASDINLLTSNVNDSKEFATCVNSFAEGDFSAGVGCVCGEDYVNRAIAKLRDNLYRINYDISELVVVAADGDLSRTIDERKFEGDWRSLANKLNAFVKAVYKPISEASSALLSLSKGDLNARTEGDYKGDFATIKNALNDTASELSSYIEEIRIVLSLISEGDLRRSVEQEFVGQFSEIKFAINNIVDKLNQIFLNISDYAYRIAQNAAFLANSGRSLSLNASRQIEIVEDINSLAGDISGTIEETDKAVARADDISNDSKQNAKLCKKEMNDTREFMNQITESSKRISKIVTVIDEIAAKTNLLAINASIEASRAGDQGRGFAVVAEEVRTLAGKCQEAVKEAENLIEESNETAKKGAVKTDATAAAFETLFINIEDISSLISKIANSSRSQTKAIEEIVDKLSNMTESARDNSEESTRCSNLSVELSVSADKLRDIIRDFKLKVYNFWESG
jgi:methyl-accepting chemotaxis protein